MLINYQYARRQNFSCHIQVGKGTKARKFLVKLTNCTCTLTHTHTCIAYIWGNAFIIFWYFHPALSHTTWKIELRDKKNPTERHNAKSQSHQLNQQFPFFPLAPACGGAVFFSQFLPFFTFFFLFLVDAKEIWRQFYAKSKSKKIKKEGETLGGDSSGWVDSSATMANKNPEKIANRIKIAETDTQTHAQNYEST